MCSYELWVKINEMKSKIPDFCQQVVGAKHLGNELSLKPKIFDPNASPSWLLAQVFSRRSWVVDESPRCLQKLIAAVQAE